MKNSGYKDAAHSIAELIDNSIQAGESKNGTTNIEVICIEKGELIQDRSSSRINKIAVYDDASGMTEETLSMSLAFGLGTRIGAKKGMGKYGIGLPNASIAQANRVDVWSWQNGKYFHTYLDLEEIADKGYDEIPEPKNHKKLPDEWANKIKGQIRDSGTLVIWSDLERLMWRRHKSFFSNTEFIVGRMYRYFISNKKCSIRMAAYASGKLMYEDLLKPNDPLYLMKNTSTPEPFSNDPGFEPFGENEFSLQVTYKGEKHEVILKFSIARQQYRREIAEQGKNPGTTKFGQHCSKNQGISIVRANREIELNHTFNIHYNPIERWWGIEVAFNPSLDEVFGVTNNKQAATAFRQLSFEEIADDEDIPVGQVKSTLREQDDIRLPIIEISNEISSKLTAIRNTVKRQTETVRTKKKAEEGKDVAGRAATSVTQRDGKTGLSDKLEGELTQKEKEKAITDELKKDGIETDEEGEKIIAQSWLNDSKFIFNSAEISGSRYIFDISQPAGKIKVTINTKHPAYQHFIKKIEEEDDHSYNTLKLFFAAWARMEDIESQSQERKDMLEDIRYQWGNIAKEMIDEYTS